MKHRRVFQLLISGVVFFVLMGIFCLTGYIDFSVVVSVYLPIFCVAGLLLCFKKPWPGILLLLGAVLGLLAEYLHHLARAGQPNMLGGFLNVALIVLGLAAGIVIQVIADRRRKKAKQPG